MKKFIYLIMPLMAISLASNCNNNPSVPSDYAFTFQGEHCSLNNEAKYKANTVVDLTFTVDEGYTLPDTIHVVGDDNYVYSKENKTLHVTINKDMVVVCNAKTTYPYKVTFVMNGATSEPIAPIPVMEGGTIASPETPTKPGFTFQGWFVDEALTEGFTFDTKIYQNYVLYANWGDIKTYTVKFFIDNEEQEDLEETIEFGHLVSRPMPIKKEGMSFDGWYEKSDYSGEKYKFNTPLTGEDTELKLYARFIRRKQVMITFIPNGGQLDDYSDELYRLAWVGATVGSAPSISNGRYTFAGWYTDNVTFKHEFIIGKDGTKVTGTTTLYAKWTFSSYAITWLNEDGITLKIDYVESGETPSYGSNPSRSGDCSHSYTFKGWSPTIVPANSDKAYVAQYDVIETSSCNVYFQVSIPEEGAYVSFTATGTISEVDWGDGVQDSDNTHQYTTGGIYDIRINGEITSISCSYDYLTGLALGNTITFIDEYAFYGSSLTSITFPKSVTSIEDSAFYGCSNLTIITFEADSELETIGDDAFSYCSSLTSITFPKSVTSIGEYAFSGCSSLTSITFEVDSLLEEIGENAFYECSSLTSITIPKNVTFIGGDAFEYCSNLTSITFEEGSSLEKIGEYAFYECSSLTSITFPKSVTSIEDNAFDGCSNLTSIAFEEGSSLEKIGENAFYGCSSLTFITIPKNVTSIGEYAFDGCSSLTSITFEADSLLEEIGENAFYNCSSLTSITIPKSVTSIGEYAFSGCSSLETIAVETGNTKYDSRKNCNAIITSVEVDEVPANTLIVGCKNTIIPNSVTSIGDDAFDYCESLTSIVIPNSVTSIGDDAFEYCSNLTSITFEEGSSLEEIGGGAFYDCSSLTSITIPKSVTSIGEYAFSGCSSLETIAVETGNTKYDSRKNCNAIITSVDIDGVSANTLIAGCKNTIIPNSVTSIGDSAFYYCESLTSIVIPNSVTSIGDDAFEYCFNLTSITFEEGSSLEEIGEYAFYDCSSLTSITIPKNVAFIGHGAFSGCSNLSEVVITNIDEMIEPGGSMFSNCDVNLVIKIPNNLLEDYQNDPYWSQYHLEGYTPSF